MVGLDRPKPKPVGREHPSVKRTVLHLSGERRLRDFLVERDKGIGVNPHITTQTEKDKVMDQIGRSDKEHVNELRWKLHQMHQRHMQALEDLLK